MNLENIQQKAYEIASYQNVPRLMGYHVNKKVRKLRISIGEIFA